MALGRDSARLAEFIQNWMAEQVREAGARGIIVGLSGGVDSAVVAALARRAFGREMMALILPCHSAPEDEEDARLVAEVLDLPFRSVDLTGAYDVLKTSLENGLALSRLSCANLKARLRMSALYAAGQTLSLLVCGTSNRAERETGYFTKFGDSAADLLPLADLLKTEVRSVASFLGVPEKIVLKVPSAGLWSGQTDEGDMGLTYEQLDRYLATGRAEDPALAERIETMRKRSEHKRRPVPICLPPG